MKATQRIPGVEFVGNHEFCTGHEAPIFDVKNAHAFTQLVGYAKYANRNCGTVYYRGQCKLHPDLKPSICRVKERSSLATKTRRLEQLINELIEDEQLMRELKLEGTGRQRKRLLEATLQHYGIPTRCIDVVDNHWIALWFGLHECETRQANHEAYALYRLREVSFLDTLSGVLRVDPSSCYQYVLLLSANNDDSRHIIDLRIELPSTFLRPHAQHGVILENDNGEESYDYANNVVGILQIRIDYAFRWLGQGQLVSYSNLFPSPMHDHGYSILLQSQELFKKHGSMITHFTYDVQ